MVGGIKIVWYITEDDRRKAKALGVLIFRKTIATRFKRNHQIFRLQLRKQIILAIEVDEKRVKKYSRRFL